MRNFSGLGAVYKSVLGIGEGLTCDEEARPSRKPLEHRQSYQMRSADTGPLSGTFQIPALALE